MKKNIVKNASKLSVILVVFLMLTLVFTLYQTSINSTINQVATELGQDVVRDDVVAQAASLGSFNTGETTITGVSHSEEDSGWDAGADTSSASATVTVDSNSRLMRAINGSQIQHAVRISVSAAGGGSAEKASVDTTPTAAHTGDVTSGTSNFKDTPKNTTGYVAWVQCSAEASWPSSTTASASCIVVIKCKDTSGISFSSSNAWDNSGTLWQATTNKVTVSVPVGLEKVTVSFTPLAGGSSETLAGSGFDYTSSSTYKGSHDIYMGNQGKYVITGYDNLGRSSSKTIWYYKSVITATVNHANYGSAYVTTSSSASGSSSTLNNRYGGQSYYLYATPKTGYYFTGWTATAGASGTLGVGTSVDGKWRSAAQYIPSTPTTDAFTWQAQFSEIAPHVLNNGTASPAGTTSYTFNYNGQPIPLTLSAPSGYSGTIKFSGTSAANITYQESTTAPTYAGTYTAYVNLTYDGVTIGTATYSITINKINVWAKPTFPALSNSIANSKVYDGNNVISQTNTTDWALGTEVTSNTTLYAIVNPDDLVFTTISADFKYNNKNVGTNKAITYNTDATITSTKSNDANTNKNVAASYIFNKSGDGIQGTITPKLLTIKSAGYGQCYDGSTTIDNLKGYYVSGNIITTELKGKVYDGKTNATLAGVVLSGYVAGDNIGFAIGNANSTAYLLPSDSTTGIISQAITATFANQHAGLSKTVTATIIFLAGNDKGNYYVTVTEGSITAGGNNATTAYNSEEITLTQPGCAIAQKDVTIAIASHTNKDYDGTNLASGIKYMFVDGAGNEIDPIQTQDSGTKDNLYIDGTGANATYSSANANYYNGAKAPDTRYLGNALTISATGIKIGVGQVNGVAVTPNTQLTNYRLTSSNTAVYAGSAWSEANYNAGTFIAIRTKLLSVTLISEGKVYDGNSNCYDYSFTTNEFDCDKGKINVTATVTFNDYNAKLVTATAYGITISSDDNTHINYHLDEDENTGVKPVSDENQVQITPKDIKDVVIAPIASRYYSGTKYAPTSDKVTDTTLIDKDDKTKTFAQDLVAGTDFTYSYTGDFINTTGTNGNNTYAHVVVLNGTGNYTGTASTDFTILQAEVKIDGVQNITIVYGQAITTNNIVVTTVINKNSYELDGEQIAVAGGWKFVTSVANRPVVADTGSKTIQFTPTDTWNYATPVSNALTLTVNKRPITITANNLSLEFGATFSFDNSGMTYSAYDAENHTGRVGDDSFGTINCVVSTMKYALPAINNGAYVTDSSGYILDKDGARIVMVGEYDITRTAEDGNDTISNGNYDITFVPAKYTITKTAITIQATGTTKVYGTADPDFNYTLKATTANVSKNLIEGALSRNAVGTANGENVGTYGIVVGTINTSAFNKQNYNITYTGANLLINPRPVHLTPVAVNNHYFGENIVISQTNVTASAVAGKPDSGIADRDLATSLADLFTLTIILATENETDKLGGYDDNPPANTVVGTYDLVIKTIGTNANPNYTITTSIAKYIIVPRPIIIVPNEGQGKTYDGKALGKTDVFGYTFIKGNDALTGTALVNGYTNINGALTRVDGKDVGNYLITQGTLNNDVINGAKRNANYEIIFSSTPVYYTISPLDVTVTPNKVTIRIGDPIPSNDTLTYTTSPSTLPDELVGGLLLDVEGTPTEVGTYNIIADAEMLGDGNKNYNITMNGSGKFEITKLTALLTPTAGQNAVFGATLSFGVNEGQINLPFTIVDNLYKDIDLSHLIGDEFNGSLSIDVSQVAGAPIQQEGESNADYHARKNTWLATNYLPAGEYDITIGDFSAKDHGGVVNYIIVCASGTFTINPKPVVVSVPKLKTEGTESYVDANTNGKYDEGEEFVDSNANGKYDEVQNLTKVYDKAVESGIEYYINPSDIVPGYPVANNSALSRKSGVNVGSYEITIGNFNSLNATNNRNYSFSLATNPNSTDGKYYFTISPRYIYVTPVIPEGKDKISSVYGDSLENLNIAYTSCYFFDTSLPGIIAGDSLNGSLSKQSGIDVTAEGYEITIGSLNRAGDKYNPNYNVTLDTKGIRYYITPRPITVTANNVSQVFGEIDSILSVSYSFGGLIGISKLEGEIERAEGEIPGTYQITQGTMDESLNPNYDITFVNGTYTITKRPIYVSTETSIKKGYNEDDPVFNVFVTDRDGNPDKGQVPGYEIGVTLTREQGENMGYYNYVYILDNDEDCENNKYYSYSQFKVNANYDNKRVFVDVRNSSTQGEYMFQIDRGQAQFIFSDEYTYTGKTLQANTYFDTYKITLEYNGQNQSLNVPLDIGGDENFKDTNGNGTWDEGEEYLDTNGNGKWDNAEEFQAVEGITVNSTISCTSNPKDREFKNAGEYKVILSSSQSINIEAISVIVNVTIKPKDLGTINPADMLSPEDLTKVYGSIDNANYSFELTTEYGDKIVATMKREEGENVGKYDFVSFEIDNANYSLSFAEGSNIDIYEITAKELVVTPSAKSIGYGNVVSSWEETLEDNVIITYTRTDATNNNAGTYDIASYEINSTNHFVTIAGETLIGKFVITPKVATITAVADSKYFDGTAIDLGALKYTATGMVGDEIPVGTLTIVADGNLDLINVGEYTIVAEGFDSASNPNYSMSFKSAIYKIEPAEITISPEENLEFVYGDEIPAFNYVITSGSVFDGYPLEGALDTAISKNVGTWAITRGTLDNNEGRNPNYHIKFNEDVTYTITKRYVKIKVDSATQVYGEPMPKLEYEFVNGTSMVEGDELHGTLSATGKNVGTYEIIMSDEFKNDNPNYEVDLDNSEAIYTITARPLTITPDAKTTAYGDALLELTYTTENMVEGDVLEGELACDIDTNVGKYAITQGTLANSNYDITFTTGIEYEITPREITVTINDASSDYGKEDALLTYSITKGNLIGNDDLQVSLVREEGTEMGTYEISGTHANANYNVTFVNGTYTIMKYKAVITVPSQYISFVEDGIARTISATCSSGAEITYSIDFEEVHNYFKTAGKYVVVLNAPETDSYYAPDPVTVYITINRPFIQSEANGIDIKLESAEGFDPTMSVEMSRLPQDYADIQAELKSNQKIVRAFTLTSTSDQDSVEKVPGKTTVTIKVPNALQEEKVVQVMVQEDGTYNLVEVDVIDGYVTLEVDSLSSFAFITEESNNYLLLIIIGAAALIVLGSVMVFLFRKRV